jgi:hypothetical protein
MEIRETLEGIDIALRQAQHHLLGEPESQWKGGYGMMPYFDDRGETLADIARSYNVRRSTSSRLTA